MEHTPGPWTIFKTDQDSQSLICGPDVEQIGLPECIANVAGGLSGSIENAKLIAAAPDLLAENERLKVINIAENDRLKVINADLLEALQEWNQFMQANYTKDEISFWDKTRAAIRKATQ